jgi:hypothetical protein
LAFNFDSAVGRLSQISNERQQLIQLLLRQFVIGQSFLPTFVLKRCHLSRSMCFPGDIHATFPCVIQSSF